MPEQGELHLKSGGERGKDIFLCHTGIDKHWVEGLAERIEAERYKNRFLGVVFDKWDFQKGGDIVVDIEREIDACRFVGVVVTRAVLGADWPTLERSIAVWSDPAGTRGRVIPLLRENVTLPASLRVRNWIDFRDEGRFEESFAELICVLRGERVPRGRGSLLPTVPETSLPYEPAPVVITSSVGADRVRERLVSDLLPVVELSQTVFSAETPLREKADINKYSDKVSHPAFLLREGMLWTFVNLREDRESFGTSTRTETTRENSFESWFGDADRARWAVELLNVCLKENAWRRFLRLDKDRQRYFFSLKGDLPKKIHWKIGGKWSRREVTARHMVTRRLADGTKEKIQVGGLPRKVVLHKTSRYTDDERKGFESALAGISHYGMLTLNRRGIFCLRPGKKAILRGTVVDFGQKQGLVYTMGYVPFLRCYPGFRIPQPIEITENWGSVSLTEAAADLLKLTKLNWNTAAFNCREPITVAFARRVGDILKIAKGKEPALHYRYYM